jgi:hypothetical protein
MGSLLRMAGLQYIRLISCVKKFNILTASPNRDSIPNCHDPQKCYKSPNQYGFRCQVSGRYRKQTTEDKGQSVSAFCHLLPDT